MAQRQSESETRHHCENGARIRHPSLSSSNVSGSVNTLLAETERLEAVYQQNVAELKALKNNILKAEFMIIFKV